MVSIDMLLKYISITLNHISVKASVDILLKCGVGSWKYSGPHLNIKTVFPRYGDSHVKDKMVVRPSYR